MTVLHPAPSSALLAPDLPAAAIGRADVVGGLVVHRRSADGVAVGHPVARAVPRALDRAADEAALVERPPGVRALRVDREDPIAVPDDRQVGDPGLELRRATPGDAG